MEDLSVHGNRKVNLYTCAALKDGPWMINCFIAAGRKNKQSDPERGGPWLHTRWDVSVNYLEPWCTEWENYSDCVIEVLYYYQWDYKSQGVALNVWLSLPVTINWHTLNAKPNPNLNPTLNPNPNPTLNKNYMPNKLDQKSIRMWKIKVKEWKCRPIEMPQSFMIMFADQESFYCINLKQQ